MKNKILEGMRRSRNVIFLTLFSTLLLTSCQKESAVPGDETDNDLQTVRFGFTFDSAIQTETEYLPITRADFPRTQTGNNYNYIIVEKRTDNNKYMVVQTGVSRIDAASYDISTFVESGKTYSCFSTTLRPGSYELIVFTQTYSTTFNPAITEGMILPDPGTGQGTLYATKLIPSVFYATAGEKILGQEVFYARTPFTVSKTTDLHSNQAAEIPVALERRCAKFRLFLQESATAPTFKDDVLTGIDMISYIDIVMADGSDFPQGLDVWGNLWKDAASPLLSRRHAAGQTVNTATFTGADGESYILPTYQHMVYAPYFLTAPGQDYTIKTQKLIGYGNTHLYPNIQWEYTGGAEYTFTLKNNHVTGIVFKLNGSHGVEAGKYPYYLEPVYSSPGVLLDPATLFHGNFEYNFN